ncbi:serpentine type 7TM GPCR chemoreceptor srsx domain-containing protein [Ditylenchus destructor]|uniref:Serpentine type 7TM GPCR chemoreceptor srsx domain-containing protein n=1 Tax=Ditylenchus destructor TaxID=166010 RepID=A0AAD4MZK7_9BILA|nr:serpentine type 7TM GPCR chemoreceptor srsx domain-containing protein [Ditylenchus destructor]
MSEFGAEYPNYLFYQTFKDKGHAFELFLVLVPNYVFAPLCWVFNSVLIYITYKNKHLHASINFLLAILALCDFCYKLNDIPSFVVITSGRNFIPLLTCFYCQVIPLYGLLGVFLFTAIIALDRTILLLFPLRHRRLNVKWYTLFYASASFLYITWIVSKAYMFARAHSDWPVVCTMEDTFLNEVGEFISYLGILELIIAVVLYMIILVGFQCCVGQSYNGQDRRLLKSLSVIFFIIIFVYALNIIVRLVLPVFHLDPITYRLTTIILGLPINIDVTAGPVVLYIFSTEYRRAIQDFCSDVLAKIRGQKRTIQVQSSLVLQNPFMQTQTAV